MGTLRAALDKLLRADLDDKENIHPHELLLLEKLRPNLDKLRAVQYFEKPNKLRKKIKAIYEKGDYFYIGYTRRIADSYLWTTGPKNNVRWRNFAHRFTGEPRKVMTYYATADRETNETTLVHKNYGNVRCLNGRNTDTRTSGYVYVVEYAQPLREDLLRFGDLVCTPWQRGVKDIRTALENGRDSGLLSTEGKIKNVILLTFDQKSHTYVGVSDIITVVLHIRDIAKKSKRPHILSQVTTVLRELYWLKLSHIPYRTRNSKVQELLDCSSLETFFDQLISTWTDMKEDIRTCSKRLRQVSGQSTEAKKQKKDIEKCELQASTVQEFIATLLQLEEQHLETLLQELAPVS